MQDLDWVSPSELEANGRDNFDKNKLPEMQTIGNCGIISQEIYKWMKTRI